MCVQTQITHAFWSYDYHELQQFPSDGVAFFVDEYLLCEPSFSLILLLYDMSSNSCDDS